MSSPSILDDMAKQKQAFAPVALPVDDTPSNEAHAKWEAEFRVKYEAEMRMKFMSSHTAGIAISRAASTAIHAAHSAQLAIQTLSDIRSISKEARLKRLFKDMIIVNIANQILNTTIQMSFPSHWFPKEDDTCPFSPNRVTCKLETYPPNGHFDTPGIDNALIACAGWHLESNQTIVFDLITGLRTLSEEIDRGFKNEPTAISAILALKASIICQNGSISHGLYTNPEMMIEYLNEREKDIDPVIREELKQELKQELKDEIKAEMKAEFNL